MSRNFLKPTRLAVASQVAGLLTVAAGVLAILISDIARQRTDVARAEPPPPHAQPFTLPHRSDAKPR
jgi:hypothetical protein